MYYVSNGYGEDLDSPSADQMRAFLDALPADDIEHGAAWCCDADGNCMEFEVGGNLSFDRVGAPPRHLVAVSKEFAVQLWVLLSQGMWAELDRRAWQPGLRPKPTAAEVERREREMQEWLISQDRVFYDSLGAEDGSSQCRASGCDRSTIRNSVFCRSHHFEKLMGRPSPFKH